MTRPFVERGSQMFVRFQDHGLTSAGTEAAITRGFRVVARVRSSKTGRLQVFDTSDQATLGSLVTGGTLVLLDTKADDDGEVVQVSATSFRNFNRGQLYMTVAFGLDEASAQIVARGYVWAGHNLHLGEDVDPGPGGGEGALYLIAVLDDAAPAATTTFTCAATNAFRKILGYAWYYNASSDAATRVLAANVVGLLGAVPTGFTSVAYFWSPTQLTLTASEEGIMWAYAADARDGIAGLNDNGTLTYSSTATAPIPFPLLIAGGDPATMVFTVSSGNANDRNSLYIIFEEWVLL